MRVLLIASPADGPPEACEADALVLSHPPAAPPDWLAARRPGAPALLVRVARNSPSIDGPDLDAALALRPDGIVLPGVEEGGEIARLGVRLSVHEAETGLPDGATRIVAGLASARAILRLGGGPRPSPRLRGLFYDPSALARDLGLDPCGPGPLPAPLAQARGLLVLAAAAMAVPALACECSDIDAARAARRDGFRGGFAGDARGAAILARVFRPERGGIAAAGQPRSARAVRI